MEIQNTPKLNPWISIWIKPRATIQQIVDTNPNYNVLSLAACLGIARALDRAVRLNIGDETNDIFSIIMIALVGGTISGIIMLYVFGVLLRWTGTWIGGKAPAEHIRTAIAWGNSCSVVILLLWIPQFIIFGTEMFTQDMPGIVQSLALTLLFLGFAIVELTISLWGIVVFLKCLGQVQGFSAWKALANVILAGLVLFASTAVIALGFVLLQRNWNI